MCQTLYVSRASDKNFGPLASRNFHPFSDTRAPVWQDHIDSGSAAWFLSAGVNLRTPTTDKILTLAEPPTPLLLHKNFLAPGEASFLVFRYSGCGRLQKWMPVRVADACYLLILFVFAIILLSFFLFLFSCESVWGVLCYSQHSQTL